MIVYLLKSGVCLAAFFLFYKLFLEKENFNVFKRFYLIGGLVLAFVIPLITFTTIVGIEPIEYIPYTFSDIPIEQQMTPEVSTINYIPIILWTVYGFGVVLFGLKFLFNLFQIGNKIRNNPNQKTNQFTHVLLQHLITPHTFFSYIFLNKQQYEEQKIPQEVFWHEETHAIQKHSFDVVFVELLQVVFWFNPLFYFIKKDIKLNHEFLADRAVLNKGVSLTAYQEILLTFSTNSAEPQLANALNYSSIKKRFTIMKTKTSKKAVWIKSLILLPLVAVLVYSFSEQKVVEIEFEHSIAQKDLNKQEERYVLVSSNVATEQMMDEYKEFMRIYEKSKIIYGGKYKRAIAIYNLMTDAQKASVTKYPNNVLNHRMSETQPRKPSEAEFNSWKDKSKFAIWIDSKNVDNSILNNFKKSDIFHFSGSFVHKNARSKRFPQTQQYSLYTKQGFEEIYKKADYKKYMRLLEKYNKEVEFFNETDKTNNSELLILKQQADYVYKNFTEEELKKYNPPKSKDAPRAIINTKKGKQENDVPNIYVSITNNKEILLNGENIVTIKTFRSAIEQIIKDYTPNQLSKVKAIIEADKTTKMGCVIDVQGQLYEAGVRERIYTKYSNEVGNQQISATPQEITEYNKLAQQYNATPKGKLIVNIKELEHLTYIFDKMTIEQKKRAEPFPNYPPPPPPPAKVGQITLGNGDVVELIEDPVPQFSKDKVLEQDALENYIKKNNAYEKLRDKEPHYKDKSSAEKKELDDLFSELGSLYFKLSREDQQKTKRPIYPLSPYIKLMKDGKEYYKKRSEITEEEKAMLPPPPPPPSMLNEENVTNGSKNLQNAQKKYIEEVESYLTAVKNYKGTKKTNNELNAKYKKVMELHKEYSKLATEEGISPPPPPPPATPPNPTDHMIEMAKKGAIFYYEDKKISSDKAIDITKKNKSINVQVLSESSSRPIVKLSTKPYKN